LKAQLDGDVAKPFPQSAQYQKAFKSGGGDEGEEAVKSKDAKKTKKRKVRQRRPNKNLM